MHVLAILRAGKGDLSNVDLDAEFGLRPPSSDVP